MTVSTVKQAGALLVCLSLLMVAAMASSGCLGDDDDDDNRAPTAVITEPEDDAQVRVGERIMVDGRDSTDPDGDDLDFFWTSNLDHELSDKAVDYVYLDTDGTHFITLKVVDPDGAESEAEVRIEVLPENQPPVAIISSPRDGDSYSENEDISFNGENSYDPDEYDAIVTYSWKIDGSAVSSEMKFSRQLAYGAHTAELEVKDQEGLTHTDTASFTVTNLPPFARIKAPDDGDEFFEGDEITFNASKSVDPEGGDLEFEWDFGDDSGTEDGEVVEHTYDTPGDYEVTLMVTDDLDQSDNETIEITIKPKGPVARMTSNVTATRTEMNISFDASDSTTSGGSPIVNYTWDFDDGSDPVTTDAENTTIEHNWTDSGYYNVTLTVIDANNMTNETVLMVTIMPRDFQDTRTGSNTISSLLPPWTGSETFPMEDFRFLQNSSVEYSFEVNGDWHIELQNSEGSTIHEDEGTDDGGGIFYFDRNATENSSGTYSIQFEISTDSLVDTSASYSFDIRVNYGT